jgi:lipoate-protein ligase B
MQKRLQVINLGRKDYYEIYQYQLELQEKRYNGQIEDTLLLVEHPPVFTIGKSGSRENILIGQDILKKEGISIYQIERGGDVTYHGPGQIVGYPIINLNEHRRDIHWLINSYEEVFIRLLKKEFQITARRIPGLTGVWIENRKITAIGVAVKRWVTYHGFAFNVDPELKHFGYIIPCGIADKGVTSLKQEKPGLSLTIEEIINRLVYYFLEVFGMELVKDEV